MTFPNYSLHLTIWLNLLVYPFLNYKYLNPMVANDRQTEEIIFEAATEVFIRKGMDGARMQEIADKAGINKALLHYYYRSKEKLFNAVFEKLSSHIFSKFAPVFDENLPFEEKIRFFYREHLEILRRNPELPAFILNEMNRNPEWMKKLIRNFDMPKVWERLESLHKTDFEKYHITRENFPQLMTSIAALSVFPFAAKGVFSTIFESMGYDFDDYIEKRKTYAAEFVINALR